MISVATLQVYSYAPPKMCPKEPESGPNISGSGTKTSSPPRESHSPDDTERAPDKTAPAHPDSCRQPAEDRLHDISQNAPTTSKECGSYRNRVRRQRRSFSARPRPEAPCGKPLPGTHSGSFGPPAVDPALKSGTHRSARSQRPATGGSSGFFRTGCTELPRHPGSGIPLRIQITRWAGVIGIIRNTSIRSGAPHRMVTNPRTPQITETGKQI